MNTAEQPQAPAHLHPVQPEDAQAVANVASPGTVLLSFGPMVVIWPVAFAVLVASVLALAAPGLVLVAAVFAVFAGPYYLIRRRRDDEDR